MMKFGIVGLPGSGKSTVFDALTHSMSDHLHKKDGRIGTVRVPDTRLDMLSQLYQPKKSIFAQVEYLLPGQAGDVQDSKKETGLWVQVRNSNALIHIIRNFKAFGQEPATPEQDFYRLDQELILSDLMVIEKRLERLELDNKRGKKYDPDEFSLLQACRHHLEEETPLRKFPDIAASPILRGFAFLSAKPMLVLFNNEEDDDSLPDAGGLIDHENCMVIRGKLEQELAEMSEDEAQAFLDEFRIDASAMDRVIHRSFKILGLISFFTVGDDEVRAWTVAKHTQATDAAGTIHTDMKRGFIRAEVVSYEDLMSAGSYAEARKKGIVRLEGKTYEVQDGDILTIRFNV